jgi:hypothetical protein
MVKDGTLAAEGTVPLQLDELDLRNSIRLIYLRRRAACDGNGRDGGGGDVRDEGPNKCPNTQNVTNTHSRCPDLRGLPNRFDILTVAITSM